MHFITSLLFLAITSTLTSALPHSKRQNTRITPSQVNKLYERLPTNTVSDGWGEVSQDIRLKTPSKVHSLFAFQLSNSDGGQTCNLRFDKPEIALGTLSFKVYDFIPTNGRTFDSKKASWNKKSGKTGKSLATFKVGGKNKNLVYSFPCPKGGKMLNYELVPEGGVNMQWPYPDSTGLWLEVVKAPKPPVVRIDMKDQVNLREGWGGTGSIQYGEINTSEPGKTVTTLVGFIMPSEDYTKRTCNLRFGKVTSASGTKTFKVFDFVPNNGLPIFQSWLISWSKKGGVRKAERATYKVGGNGLVLSFPCPKRGTGINSEFAPTKEPVNIKWDTTNKGGFWIEVV
ncbi:hypothetical protein K440DRAFT_616224 [Wilcoxina mikolae CBS 423.85]|nr:hypothetical protein K440DRAFT_616224 [Wilcoxina mikolae CBS 423.85]